MESFFYIAKDKNSKTSRGQIQASSREEAIRLLQAQGLYIISLKKIEKAQEREKYLSSQRFSHSRIKLEDLVLFTRQLATLLASGVPLLRSLETVSSQCASRKLSKVLLNMVGDIREGLSLTESISKYPSIFSSLWIGLVETGEASGNLSQVLDKLAGYLELRQEFMRKLISAIIYPLILLVASIAALLFFSLVILPKFKEIFSQFEVKLPFLTQLIFNIVTFVRTKFFWILGMLAILGICLRFFVKSSGGKEFLDRLKLNLPLLKDFFYTYFLERFTSTAYILFESGVPVVYALDVIQRSIDNIVFEETLERIKKEVKGGKSLSSELAKAGFFPPMVIEMTTIGEEVGNFPEMFSRLASHYQTALTTKVERFTSFFEPAMILFMGATIGIIVISLFMPLFQLASAVK